MFCEARHRDGVQLTTMRFRFDWRYAVAAIVIFAALTAIAVMLRTGIVRTHIGDVGVIALIYCAVRTVLEARPLAVVTGTVLFAFAVEFAQLFEAIRHLGLSDNQFAVIVLGASFDPWDLAMYVIGGLLVLAVEAWRRA